MPSKHKLKADDMRKMKPEERLRTLGEARRELVTLRYKASVGTLTNPGRLRELRRNIARILTVMGEEEIGEAKGEAKQG